MTWRNTNIPQADDHPVLCVSWNDATAFCDWAAKKTGLGMRLPTEAEWEYACRAGTRTIWSFGDQEAVFTDFGWCVKNSGLSTRPVGQKRPNAWGLYDMQGNAWQLCQDGPGPYTGDAVDPIGSGPAGQRSLRGGCWGGSAIGCRAATRAIDFPAGRSTATGFRVLLLPP
jgi:formylglycine-generating enzyme required for sulfatase activity